MGPTLALVVTCLSRCLQQDPNRPLLALLVGLVAATGI